MLYSVLTIPFYLKAIFTSILYIFCISYSSYMTLKFLYKPLRVQTGLNKIDWLVNMFLPLLAADRLGRFIYDDLSKSKFNFEQSAIYNILLFFNKLSYLLRLGMVLASTVYIIWGLVSNLKTKKWNLISVGYKSITLLFLLLLILLYPLESDGGYIFGYWNKICESTAVAR